MGFVYAVVHVCDGSCSGAACVSQYLCTWCCRHFDALGVTLAERTMVANSSGVTLRASSRSHEGVPGSSLSINGWKCGTLASPVGFSLLLRALSVCTGVVRVNRRKRPFTVPVDCSKGSVLDGYREIRDIGEAESGDAHDGSGVCGGGSSLNCYRIGLPRVCSGT